MQKRLECTIFGRVQMVMFRDFVQRTAKKKDIVGTVRNTTDGGVFVRSEGEEADLKEFLAIISHGPMFARVDEVEVSWTAPLGGFKTFDILY